MTGLLFAEGYFPHVCARWNEKSQPLQRWDKATLAVDPSTIGEGYPNGLKFPSQSASERVTVYGPGTAYPVGLTLEQYAAWYWRVRRWRVGFDFSSLAAFPSLSVTATGKYKWRDEWDVEHEETESAHIDSSTNSTPTIPEGFEGMLPYLTYINTNTYPLDETQEDDHLKLILTKSFRITRDETGYYEDRVVHLHAGESKSDFSEHGVAAVGASTSLDIELNSSRHSGDAYIPPADYFTDTGCVFAENLYWPRIGFYGAMGVTATVSGNGNTGDTDISGQASSRYDLQFSEWQAYDYDYASNQDVPRAYHAVLFKVDLGPLGIVWGELPGWKKLKNTPNEGELNLPDPNLSAFDGGGPILAMAAEKWFTYGGLYNTSTGAKA